MSSREEIVSYLQSSDGATKQDLCEDLDVPLHDVHHHLRDLDEFGLLEIEDTSDAYGATYRWPICNPRTRGDDDDDTSTDESPIVQCPTCDRNANSVDTEPVEGDHGELYCSIGCLNEEYST